MAQQFSTRPTQTRPVRRRRSIHLGVDLSGTAARPAVWRTHGSRPAQEFDRDTTVRLARVATHGALDLVVFGPDFTLGQSRDTALGGVLDPAVAARRIGPSAPRIGLVAHLDPGPVAAAHVAQALAAVDEHGAGRAGWQVTRTSADAVREVQQHWDDIVASRTTPDVPEQRVSHDGVRFAVRGRPVGRGPVQPRVPVVVAVPAADEDAVAAIRAVQLAGQVADLVRVRARDLAEAAALRAQVRAAAHGAGRHPDDVRVLVDLFTVIGPDRDSSTARLDLLRRLEDEFVDEGSLIVAGSPVEHAVTIQDWVDAGAADGFVVRPASLASDLDAFVAAVVPVLQGSGYLRAGYPGPTLRETLALPEVRERAVVGG